jgi:hypothetical protein
MVPLFILKRINMSSLQQPDKGGGYKEQKNTYSTQHYN